MKSYEIQPTEQNLIDAFRDNTLERNVDLFHFLTLLNNVEDSCSIALDSSWGSGKTFFVKQAQLLINAYNDFSLMEDDQRLIFKNFCQSDVECRSHFDDSDLVNQVPIYYDAWLNDNDTDPILSLVFSILSEFESGYKFEGNNSGFDKARQFVNMVLSFTPFGGNIPKIIETDDWLSEIKRENDIHKIVTDFLDSLMEERGDRLVIFVDELDRCSPTYAVKFLERIKHYFTNERITFVFSVNISQLQHTVKKHYGDEFDAERYLDRFFDLRLSLPSANIRKFYNSLGVAYDDNMVDIINMETLKYFDFQLRDTTKFLRMIKMIQQKTVDIMSHYQDYYDEDFHYSIILFSPIMLALKMTNMYEYYQFINGNGNEVIMKFYKDLNLQSLLGKFLDRQESFGYVNEQSSIVDCSTIASRIYRAVFKDYKNDHSTQIGSVIFKRTVKNDLINHVSMISGETYFEPKNAPKEFSRNELEIVR